MLRELDVIKSTWPAAVGVAGMAFTAFILPGNLNWLISVLISFVVYVAITSATSVAYMRGIAYANK